MGADGALVAMANSSLGLTVADHDELLILLDVTR